MRLRLALVLLLASAPATAQQAPVCGIGQPCPPNGQRVPFPVVSPVQGLNNILTYPLRRNQQPPPPPAWYQAPIATPPPVLPPGTQ
jgi:hypothetical protein